MFKKVIKKYCPPQLLSLLYKIYKVLIYRTKPKHSKPMQNSKSLGGVIAYNKFGGYFLPLQSIHRPASQATLRGIVWENETIDYLVNNCEGGDIIHAGTYFGDFLPALSQACDENNFIWAFEPNQENFRCAEITCLINKLENVNLYNAGLGALNSSAFMNTLDSEGKSLGGSSKVIESDSNMDSSYLEKVKIVSLDTIIPQERNISVLQLDIEGYEKEALMGAIDILKRCRPILLLENPLPDPTWLEQNILSLGYKFVKEVQGNSIFK